MDAANNCTNCRNQRWVRVRAKWIDDKLAPVWEPFGRDEWGAYGVQVISAALASKTLKACSTCNAENHAPWAKKFKADQASSTSAANGAANGNPW